MDLLENFWGVIDHGRFDFFYTIVGTKRTVWLHTIRCHYIRYHYFCCSCFVAAKIPKQIAEQQLKLESEIERRQEDLEKRQIKIALYEHRLKYWNVAKDIYLFLKWYLDFMDKTDYKEKTN